MFYALSWFVVALLFGLWSLTAWTLHALAAWTVASAGTLSGAASGTGVIVLPDWLTPWVPPQVVQWVSEGLAQLGPLLDGLLQAAPTLAAGITVAAWVIWAIGSLLLLLMGAAAHLLIAVAKRRSARSGPGAGPTLVAG